MHASIFMSAYVNAWSKSNAIDSSLPATQKANINLIVSHETTGEHASKKSTPPTDTHYHEGRFLFCICLMSH